MKKYIKFIKNPLSITALVIIIGVTAGYIYYKKGNKILPETIEAKRENVIQEVSVTGKVKPAKEVSLAFEKSGRVNWIGANVGNFAQAGQIIAQLDSSELAAQLQEAESNIQYQNAKLDELKSGTRPEEIQIAESKVANARVSLKDAMQDLSNRIQDAYTKSDDAVRGRTDQLFSNPSSINPQINFYNFYQQQDVEWRRFNLGQTLAEWQSLIIVMDANTPELYLEKTNKNLIEIRDYLNLISIGVNALTTSSTLSKTTLDSYKTDVSTGRTNIYTAITNLATAEEKLKTAKSTLTIAEDELTLKKAGAIPEQITAQEAQVKQAEAKMQIIRAQMEKNILRSPINGIVTKQDAKVGEIISANAPLVSIISSAKFEIETNVPEADIAKIKIGNEARMTLDAYGNDIIFAARVVSIDPAETMIEGVATYKTTLQSTEEDSRLKSGMTANLDILTAKKENVIAIPYRAITEKNGVKIVKILDGAISRETEVETGLRGSDGNIEIISGVNEGDKIIISETE